MLDSKQTVLTIKNPPQYGVIREDKSKISQSIFYSTYVNALKNVVDIINTNGKSKKEEPNISPERLNTTIAFVGKRGSGKSTAMCSFAGILSSISSVGSLDWVRSEILSSEDISEIESKSFKVLDAIDSAQLGVKETIIGRISAAMYSQYKQYVKNNEHQLSAEKKRAFIHNLSKVNQYAVLYHTGEWFKREESLLDDTYHVSTLRNEMNILVQSYLKFVSGKEDVQNEYLVISIDDLDMGIENSFVVMEEIRKFLCISNVIVLVTLRMDQIHVALKAKFEKQLESKIESVGDKALIEDLAYRYTEKLFPHNRQHQMPVISHNQLIEWIADFQNNNPENKRDNNPENREGKDPRVLYSILGLIWQKTLMIPVCNSDGDHLLVPRNLRSLCNLVSFLQNLPDAPEVYKELIKNGKQEDIKAYGNTVEKELLRNNLRAFSQYLVANIRSFEQEHISDEDRKFAEELISVIHNIEHIPLKKMNACIAGDILYYLQNQSESSYYRKIFEDIKLKTEKVKISKNKKNAPIDSNEAITTIVNKDIEHQDKNEKCENELNILISSCLHPECISLGDLMFVLGKIDSKTRCWYIKYLIEVIRTLWSAKMTEEYFTKEIHGQATFYYNVVGNLIVNPDIGFFNNDKLDFDSKNKKQSPAFYVCDTTLFDPYWRRKRKIEYEKAKKKIKHPLAALTQKKHRGLLPFYSLDFIYRFYEILHDEIEIIDSGRYNNFDQKVSYLYGESGAIYMALDILTKWVQDKILSYSQNIVDMSKLKKAMADISDRKSRKVFINELKKCSSYTKIKNLIENINEYEIEHVMSVEIQKLTKDIEKGSTPIDTLIEKILKIVD